MLKENLIDRMTLFTRKGAGLRVRSRKSKVVKRYHSELERTKRAHQEHLHLGHSQGVLINGACEFQVGRFRKRKPVGCGRSRCLLCHFEKIFGIPSVSDRVRAQRFIDSLEDHQQEE